MSEFKKYVERRQRVEAFQVLGASQAEMVAQLLGASSFALHYAKESFHIDCVVQPFHGSEFVQRVDRGDYLVRNDDWVYQVVNWREFREAWEEQK